MQLVTPDPYLWQCCLHTRPYCLGLVLLRCNMVSVQCTQTSSSSSHIWPPFTSSSNAAGLAQCCIHWPCQRLPSQESLPDEVIAAMRQAIHDVLLVSLGADHDDGHHGIGHGLPQLHAELLARHVRHHAVQQDEVRQHGAGLHPLQSLPCI